MLLVSYPDPHRSCGWNTSPPTRVVGLVSSCTNFCPVAPECCSDQSDLRYALIAYSSYLSKLSVMAVRLEMDDVQVIRAIQSAGERMGYAKVKDEQFRVIEDVVRGRDTFVSLPTGYGVLICYGYLFDELSVLEVRSKPLTIAPKRQRARKDVTADPHLRRAAQAAHRLSPATPKEVQAAQEDPPPQVAGEQLPQRPFLPSLPCPYPLEARSQEG